MSKHCLDYATRVLGHLVASVSGEIVTVYLRCPQDGLGRRSNDFMLTRKVIGLVDASAWPLAVLSTASVCYITCADRNGGVIVLYLIALVTGLVGSVLICQGTKDVARSSLRVFVIVFAAGITCTCITYLYYQAVNGTPYAYGWSDDDYLLDDKALFIYQGNMVDIVGLRAEVRDRGSGTSHLSDSYAIVLGILYHAMHSIGFEPNPVYPRILNALFLGGVGLVVHRMSRLCSLPLWGARCSAYLCGLCPYSLFIAAHTYRDTMISFGISSFMCGLLLILRAHPVTHRCTCKWSVGGILVLGVGVAIAASLRDLYLLVLIATAIVSMITVMMRRGWSVVAVGIVAGMFIVVLPWGLSFTGQNATDLQEKLEYYHGRHTDMSGSITGAVFRLPYFISLPFRLVLRNVAPLPVPRPLATETFQRLGTVMWFFTLPFLVRSLTAAFRGASWSQTSALRVVACGFLVFYLLNIATTLQDRHVVTYLPMASVLIGHHLVSAPRTMRADSSRMAGVAVLLVIVMLLKHVIWK